MSRPVRIIADDLTGALDAAGPFAHPDRPVAVPWRRRVSGAAVAVTSESRGAPREEAVARTLRSFEEVRGSSRGTLWFKKVDSVLRGHPVAETAALFRAGGFRICVFAPAFPEMGRITRGGRQFMLGAEDPHPVGPPDLAASFAHEGLTARQFGDPMAAEADVLIVDAESSEDLAQAACGHVEREGVLWAGSRGLGAALAREVRYCPVPRIGGIIVGTTHPATRSQVERLRSRVRNADSGGPLHLDPMQPLLLDPTPDAAGPAETRELIGRAVGRLVAPANRELAIMVVGGDTLSTVLDAADTGALVTLGELRPGIPLVQAQGGHLDAVLLVTKSGGFGLPDLILDLLRSAGRSGEPTPGRR